tara:strand:+ start:153 stop:557 length:405 start_codon:yes stop_codon:yes gene_type:complete
MNIVKFEKKNYIGLVNKTKINDTAINIKKIEKKLVFFSKIELSLILNLYSKQVSKGNWRDYALDTQIDNAIFSVYKHTQDKPLYQIIKKSYKGFRNKPNFYIKKNEYILSHSRELSRILLNFEKKLSIKKLKNN